MSSPIIPESTAESEVRHPGSAAANALAAAVRRAQAAPPERNPAQEAEDYEKRIQFRRLIDPGITRPNSKEVAWASLKTLQTISENLMREPENKKYQQFKPTNSMIKARLMDPKGTLEYAIALGFRPEVKNFQPFYAFNPRKMDDLKIGAAILAEYMELESTKQERQEQAKREEKAVKEAAVKNVKLAFMDDRKTKKVLDEREKQRRAAREEATANMHDLPAMGSGPSSPNVTIPGEGHMLTEQSPSLNIMNHQELSPPPYQPESDGEDEE